MTFHHNLPSGCSECTVLIQMDVTEDNVLQDEGHEGNPSYTDDSGGNDYLNSVMCLELSATTKC